MNRRVFLEASGISLACGLFQLSSPLQGEQPPGQSIGLAPLPSEVQKKLSTDPLRPQFHLLPRQNWMNDPCAPRYFGGRYHMFFQYNPHAAVWGDMHWNHATSADMIHWTHEPLALSPGPQPFDSFGIFTGSVLPGAEIPSVLYTGTRKCSPQEETIRGGGVREVQCLAYSDDPTLRDWHKLDQPVIDAPPAGLHVTGFRDPCPWREGDRWYLIIGSGFNQVGGAVLLYTSTDGRTWSYLHPLAQGKWNGKRGVDPVDSGEMWECPDFFPLGGKHVLLYSTERKVYWNIGSLDRDRMLFHVENAGLLDDGVYYAMKSMPDATGRRILWGWVQETRSPQACIEAGWAGCMALPRLLSIDTNRLTLEPVPELAKLISHTQRYVQDYKLGPLPLWLSKQAIAKRSGQIRLRLQPGSEPFQIALRAAGGTSSLLTLVYNGDRSRPALHVGDKSLPLTPDAAHFSTVEIWLDGSVLELFADRFSALTLRTYTPDTDSIRLAWHGPEVALREISISQVTPISSDRLTT